LQITNYLAKDRRRTFGNGGGDIPLIVFVHLQRYGKRGTGDGQISFPLFAYMALPHSAYIGTITNPPLKKKNVFPNHQP
ncbi:MAG: hypothetical protein Q4A15_04590, partial [Prevotellaceae bacterium]|nr:hypothetical protein [Prevotellaceae bacterium]